MAEEETQQQFSVLKERIEQLDQNQEDLISIMKTLRAKVTELSSPETEDGASEIAESLAEEIHDVQKKVQQIKLKEGRDIADIKEELKEFEDSIKEQVNATDESAESSSFPDLEGVWSEIEEISDRQDDLTASLDALRESFEQLPEKTGLTDDDELYEPVPAEQQEAVMAQFEDTAVELGETIQHIEQMFQDMGVLRQETSTLVEGLSEEQEYILERIGTLEDEIERLEMDEQIDKTTLMERVRNLQQAIYGREDADTASLDGTVAQRLARIEHYTEDIESLVYRAEAEEQGDVQELHESLTQLQDSLRRYRDEGQSVSDSLRADIDAIIETRSNVELVENMATALGEFQARLENDEDVQEQELEQLDERIEDVKSTLEQEFNEYQQQQEARFDKLKEYVKKMRDAVRNAFAKQKQQEQTDVKNISEQLDSIVNHHEDTRKRVSALRNAFEEASEEHVTLDQLETRLEANRQRIEAINKKLDRIPTLDTYQSYADQQLQSLEDDVAQLSELVVELLAREENKE